MFLASNIWLLVLHNNNFLFYFIGYTFVPTYLFVHAELLLGSDLSLLGSDLSCYERGGDPCPKF